MSSIRRTRPTPSSILSTCAVKYLPDFYSPHCPIRAEFDLEWCRREMVGITTSARVMKSVGIVWT